MDFLTEPLGPYLWDAFRKIGAGSRKKREAHYAKIRENRGGPEVQLIDTSGFPARMEAPEAAPAPQFEVKAAPAQVAPPPPGANVMGAPPQAAGPPQAAPAGNFAGFDGMGDVLGASMGLAGMAEEGEDIQSQLAEASALRNTASPEMRGNGRVTTAANPLEFLSTGMDRYRGFKDEEQAKKERTTHRADVRNERKRLMRAIAKMGGGVEEDDGLKEPLYGR